MDLALSVVGEVAIRVDGAIVATSGLGCIGRVTLAFLVIERHRPATHGDLAEVLWPHGPPRTWETSLRGVVSKLRGVLATAGPPGAQVLVATGFDCYHLHLPPRATVDLELAANAVEAAGEAVREGRNSQARMSAQAGLAVVARPFLSGAGGHWVEQRQAELRELQLQALEALAASCTALGDHPAAIVAAEKAIGIERFRESAYLRLMAAHASAGNRGEALRAYERCRRLLADQLGVGPSRRTEEAYVELLGQEPAPTSSSDPLSPSAVAPASASTRNLPVPLTSFIGRVREIEEVRKLLENERLVTLTGAGGCGKTRLALAVASSGLDHSPHQAWFVDLAPVADPTLISASVAAALGHKEEAGRALVDSLADHLGRRPFLLVLDNCEHVVAACADLVAALLRSCAGLKVLATSRETLGIVGEVSWRVPSLSLPGSAQARCLAGLAENESVRLFLDRARAVDRDLALGNEDAPALAEICTRLDGIPLAIELAAARAGVLTVREIAGRLDDRFNLLVTRSPTGLPRQRTLRAAVDWSQDLLSPFERAVLARISVFAGSFTLRAAEAVCAGPGVQAGDVLDLLEQLVHKSLVLMEPDTHGARYRLLETIRCYSSEKLAGIGEEAEVRTRHRDWYLAWAEQSQADLFLPDGSALFDRMEVEHDNFRVALEWSLGCPQDDDSGLRLAYALTPHWLLRDLYVDGYRWMTAVLARPAGTPEMRSKLARRASALMREMGDSR